MLTMFTMTNRFDCFIIPPSSLRRCLGSNEIKEEFSKLNYWVGENHLQNFERALPLQCLNDFL